MKAKRNVSFVILFCWGNNMFFITWNFQKKSHIYVHVENNLKEYL